MVGAMWFYENLELVIGGIFASGLVLHFAARGQQRGRYMALRRACEDAVRAARETDREPAAVVRAAELHRTLMNSWLPGWFEGFGRSLRTTLTICAALTVLALFLKGPIERGETDYARTHAHASTRPIPARR